MDGYSQQYHRSLGMNPGKKNRISNMKSSRVYLAGSILLFVPRSEFEIRKEKAKWVKLIKIENKKAALAVNVRKYSLFPPPPPNLSV